MKKKHLFKDLGYNIYTQVYYYNGQPYEGYVLQKGYRIFGIPCWTRIVSCCDSEELLKEFITREIPLKYYYG